MLLTMLIALVGAFVASLFAAHRHAEAKAWNRELEDAFCIDERKEMASRRVL